MRSRSKLGFVWVFNVADSLLCVGVALMIVYSFTATPDNKIKGSDEPAPAAVH